MVRRPRGRHRRGVHRRPLPTTADRAFAGYIGAQPGPHRFRAPVGHMPCGQPTVARSLPLWAWLLPRP